MVGYVIHVVTKTGQDSWLGQRVYLDYDGALIVKHNLQDTKRYARVYVLPATPEHFATALSIVGKGE